jgi:hypothetical protein
MFKRIAEINPYPVTDTVVFRNGDDRIKMQVRADDSLLVIGIKRANERIRTLTDDTPDDEKKTAALMLAQAIFGDDQGTALYDFYGDPYAVISACGLYFRERLAKIITKAQKRKR